MSSWTGDVEDSEEEEEESEETPFPEEFVEKVEAGDAAEISELDLINGIEEVEDEDALREAWLQLDGECQNIVENRIEDLDGSLPGDEPDPEEPDSEEESDEEEASGWGGTPVEDADDLDEEEEEQDSSESDEPAIESVDEMEDQDDALGGESDESESSAVSEAGGEEPVPSGAMSVEEAASKERRWKILVWGPPGLFKSHFSYTAPEPVAYIDTERKAQDIAHKFSDREIQIWQPEGFRETQDALQEALEWLDWWREEENEIGTIVIDSMSLVWEWAKTAYKSEAYPMKDNEEVTLSSNMGSSQESDWQHIKGMHNSEFRQWVTDSPYHFVWTAGETEDYGAVMEGDSSGGTPMKPEGEKNNIHKADSIIRARKDDDGVKVGDLTKSNFTDNLFVGLENPTFPKLRDVVEGIEEAEASEAEVDRNSLESDLGVKIIRGDPEQYE